MPKIKLLAPIKHDDENYNKDDEIVVTQKQADRLISFNVAVLIDAKANPNPKSSKESEPADPILSMTKKECIEELTAAGITADNKMTAPVLQNMIRELRSKGAGELPPSNEDELNPDEMNRDELESELTARAVDFSSENTDDELRELLVEALENDE